MQNKEIVSLQGLGRPRSSGVLQAHQKHAGRLRSLLGLAGIWHDRWFMRRAMTRELQSFDDAIYRDFGMTRDEAGREAGKPFWRA